MFISHDVDILLSKSNIFISTRHIILVIFGFEV